MEEKKLTVEDTSFARQARTVAGVTYLYDALIAEGFPLPKECRDVRLVMPVDGACVLDYSVFLFGEDLEKLGRALVRVGANR